MKRFFLFFFTLLSFVGMLTSCSVDSSFIYCEINGTVTDNTSKSLQNIRVILNSTDTTYTDLNGKFKFSFANTYSTTPTCQLKIEDPNGSYNEKDLIVSFSETDWQMTKSKTWYDESAVKTLNIQLNSN